MISIRLQILAVSGVMTNPCVGPSILNRILLHCSMSPWILKVKLGGDASLEALKQLLSLLFWTVIGTLVPPVPNPNASLT